MQRARIARPYTVPPPTNKFVLFFFTFYINKKRSLPAAFLSKRIENTDYALDKPQNTYYTILKKWYHFR